MILPALLALGMWVQSPPVADTLVPRVELGADTVLVGEHFELALTVPVPSGHTLFVPDTLARTSTVETREPARWETVGNRGDTALVVVRYILAVYRPGPTPLPGVPLVMREGAPPDPQRADGLDEGGFVAGWADLPRVPDFTYVRTVLEPEAVYVSPTLRPFDLMEGAAPRESADVAGRSWNPFHTALAGAALLGLVGLGARAIRAARRGTRGEQRTPPRPMGPAWQRAVRELDRIRALGLHEEGQVDEFYARSTGAVRRYVESLESGWGPWFTTSELVSRAGQTSGQRGMEGLADTLLDAEAVKFGGRRPGAPAALEDWQLLRAWVEASGRANGSAGGPRVGQESEEGGRS